MSALSVDYAHSFGKKRELYSAENFLKNIEQMFAFSEKVCYNDFRTNICFRFQLKIYRKRGRNYERAY